MDEAKQEAQLARMRRVATGLLVLMACVFVAARMFEARYPWLTFVRAFAEAAMVGALADWFAVTALFRRPLGLPIPHTAIIPNNKDRIGVSVATFLEHNFMTAEVIGNELRQVDFAGIASDWLRRPENSDAVARQIVSGMPALLRMIEDDDVGRFMQGRIAGALKSVHFAPMLAEVLSLLVAERRHQAVFDHLLTIVAHGLEKYKPFIRQRIHEKSPRWIPKSIDERFFVRLVDELQSVLDEMRSEDSEWRDRFDEAVHGWIEALRTSPELEARIAGWAGNVFAHPLFRAYTDQIWQDVRRRLLADAAADESKSAALLRQGLQGFADGLAQEQPVRAKLNAWLTAFATRAIVNNRHLIAGLVRRVILQWDAETVSRKFELYVGRDLQYIRINGTLVGGMVGLLLHFVGRWL